MNPNHRPHRAEYEDDLRSVALLCTRIATDAGYRTDVDEVIAAFGFDRDELEAELEADAAADRTCSLERRIGSAHASRAIDPLSHSAPRAGNRFADRHVDPA
jgi:hypothetical protein